MFLYVLVESWSSLYYMHIVSSSLAINVVKSTAPGRPTDFPESFQEHQMTHEKVKVFPEQL